VNHTRFQKEDDLPEWARRDKSYKGWSRKQLNNSMELSPSCKINGSLASKGIPSCYETQIIITT